MSIGQTLADFRLRAGLSVTEVSDRTRIREPLIRAIERDDFGICGGDFYARGHIRAIAAAVGLDPESLIEEYDTAHPPGGLQVTDLFEDEPAQRPGPERRGFALPAVLAIMLLGVIAYACYQLISGVGGSPRTASAAATGKAPATQRATTHRPTPTPTPTSAAPTTPPPAQALTVTSAAAFGPGGTGSGDHPENAQAVVGTSGGSWQTDWYATANFGNLKAGTGLLFDLGHPRTVAKISLTLASAPGTDLQLRAGDSPDLASLAVVTAKSGVGGTIHVPLGVRARYVLVWITKLPPDNAGTFQETVSGVSFTGRP